MTGLERVLAVLSERGLRLVRRPDGRPGVAGPREEVTPALLEALAEYREEVEAALPPLRPPPREFLWRGGQRHVEREGEQHPDGNAPCGAWWWRPVGDRGWRAVPDRPVDAAALPVGEELA